MTTYLLLALDHALWFGLGIIVGGVALRIIQHFWRNA